MSQRNVRQRVIRPAPPVVDERVEPRPREDELDPAVPRTVLPADAHLHPYLQFTDQEDREDRDALQRRADAHGFAPLRRLCWEALRSVGLVDRARDFLGPHWRRLFAISEPVSRTLSIEFFSTIRMLTPLIDYQREDALTFRLGGVERRMSLRQFAEHLGIYRGEELDSPAFTQGITAFPEGVSPQTVWAELGVGAYRIPNPKSTSFRDPLFRIIHRAISHGISARGDSAVGNVMHPDLLYLHCMVHEIPCQIAFCLARYLFQVRRQKHTQQIFGGGYVTRLATALGVAFPDPEIAPPKLIDLPVYVSMKVARRDGQRFVLSEAPQPAAPPVEPRPHDAEAGPSQPPTGGDAGASSSAAGAEQAATTDVHISDPPVQPPIQPPTQAISDAPQPPPSHLYSRDTLRLQRLERSQARLERIQLLECAEAAAHRAYVTRVIQVLAASTAPTYRLPDPPVPSQELTDFISLAIPEYTPDPYQDPPSSSQ